MSIVCDCGVQADCHYPNCQTFSKAVVVHELPKVDDSCAHEWPLHRDTRDDDCCKLCAVSFAQYVNSLER